MQVKCFPCLCGLIADVVTEFIEGLVETYPGLQYLDGFPEVNLLAHPHLCIFSYKPFIFGALLESLGIKFLIVFLFYYFLGAGEGCATC